MVGMQTVIYWVVLLALAFPLGKYMANVLDGKTRWLRPIEKLI